jgi:hypothetical protein
LRPEKRDVADRKERFAALNAFVMKRHGWITSIPGAPEVTMECLEGASLPDELRALGYHLVEIEPRRCSFFGDQ